MSQSTADPAQGSVQAAVPGFDPATGKQNRFGPFKVWTRAEAVEMGRKSGEARRARAVQLKILRQGRERERAKPKPVLSEAEAYRVKRLKIVRAQIQHVDQLLEGSIDAQQISQLATASAKLAEQERLLAGRPTPGASKPAQIRPESEPSFEPE